MINFSEIQNDLATSKDSLIESYCIESGLPKDVVTKLYENTALQYGAAAVKEKFTALLNVGIKSFAEATHDLVTILQTTGKEAINDMLIEFLNKESTDSVCFLKILIYILFLKDNVNFKKIADNFSIDDKLTNIILNNFDSKTNEIKENLFESVGIDVDAVKESKVPILLGVNDGCDIKQEITFYNDLKTLLARNNRRWGPNNHLDSVYKAIVDYVNSEIDYLVNKDNITTVDQNYEDIIIRQLISGDLNVMYRDINVLRPLIADIQTLTFDMVILVQSFVRRYQDYARYINRRTFDEYIKAFNNLYSKISTSRKNSLLLVPFESPNTEKPMERKEPYTANNSLMILDDVLIDSAKYDLALQPLTVQSVVDALYIIKSCSVDFNVQIRPYINQYVTKSFEVVGRLERIIAEAGKINREKTGVPVY